MTSRFLTDYVFTMDAAGAKSPEPNRRSEVAGARSPHPVVFSGAFSTVHGVTQAHCSAPPLQASFRLPRLSRDAEAVTRPRTPLRAAKWEQDSEAGAVAEFALDIADKVQIKVEAEEPIEVAEAPHQLCPRLSTVASFAGPSRGQAKRPRPPEGVKV